MNSPVDDKSLLPSLQIDYCLRSHLIHTRVVVYVHATITRRRHYYCTYYASIVNR